MRRVVEGCKLNLKNVEFGWIFGGSLLASRLQNKLYRVYENVETTLHFVTNNTGTASNSSQTVPKLLASMLSDSMTTDIPVSLDSIDGSKFHKLMTLLIAFKRLRIVRC